MTKQGVGQFYTNSWRSLENYSKNSDFTGNTYKECQQVQPYKNIIQGESEKKETPNKSANLQNVEGIAL